VGVAEPEVATEAGHALSIVAGTYLSRNHSLRPQLLQLAAKGLSSFRPGIDFIKMI